MLLQAEHLSINFGSRQLLSDVNFYLNEGDKVGIIGINGTAEAVDAIKAGTLLASTNSNPYLQGCVSTLLAARVINGESVIPEYAPALTIIDASNADAASVPDAERTCPTWEEISK